MAILPPGQKAIDHFPRFGLPQYANRFPSEITKIELEINGDLEPFVIEDPLSQLPKVDQVSDFHCVTTWSKKELRWSGVRFCDFYEHFILPKLSDTKINYVYFRSQDGYKTSLPLEDLLKKDILLADKLDGTPLNVAHGAPLRLVAPAHYGYKNPKHVYDMEFYKEAKVSKSGLMKAIDHPRGRVAQEERASFAPGWLLRLPYRMGIKSTIKDFQKALDKHLKSRKI